MEPGGLGIRNSAWMLLRDLIGERTGIYFDRDSMDLMASKISDLMAEQGIDSPLDYYYLLKYEKEAGSEWPRVENTISVRETYFWREMDQVHALVNVIVPRLAEKRTTPIRIWCAACASGEEPLTIAMALDQAGWLDRVPLEIQASDMSAAAICAADLGIYRERSFRTLPAALRERYFTQVAGGWQIDSRLRSRIRWRQANITDSATIGVMARANVIFCRNVFIYFSDLAIRNVVKTFAELMPRPGYLFVGAAESLLKFSTQFQLQQLNGAFVYVKE
jgi:chemotaxis protein methyltransferase CheR